MKVDKKPRFVLFMVMCIVPFVSKAQKTLPVEKFKPPVVKTIIGAMSDNSRVSNDEAAQLAGLSLKVTDSSGKEYPITTYQFLYKRKDQIEDPETGNIKTNYAITSQRFSETPLPKVWVDNLKRDLQPGEEFLFFDILARDDKERNFYAPQLRIIVQ